MLGLRYATVKYITLHETALKLLCSAIPFDALHYNTMRSVRCLKLLELCSSNAIAYPDLLNLL